MIQQIIITFSVLVPASLYDLYEHRVPNWMILHGLFLGLVIQVGTAGVNGLGDWMLGMFVPWILCYILYSFRMLGASDIKLFSVIGSFSSISNSIRIMLGAFLIGAIMALIKGMICRSLLSRFHYLADYVRRVVQMKKMEPYAEFAELGDEAVIPFTIAISFAYLFCQR